MKLSAGQKVFCSYAYTGEDKGAVRNRMRQVVEVFEAAGAEVYCNLDDKRTDGFVSPDQYMRLALTELKTADIIFAVQASERRSEGQLMEIGAALVLGIPLVLAQNESSVGTSYLYTLADEAFTWSSAEDLCLGISELYETIAV